MRNTPFVFGCLPFYRSRPAGLCSRVVLASRSCNGPQFHFPHFHTSNPQREGAKSAPVSTFADLGAKRFNHPSPWAIRAPKSLT